MSKPFRFRLERIRELREHDEDRAREQLASSLGAQLRGQAMLQAAAQLVDDAQAARRGGSASIAVAATDLQAHQLWLERLERERADAELALERASAEVDARRGELVEARRRREALERHKEQRRLEHRADAERREGALLDEMALTGHVRQMREAVGR